LLLVVVVLVDLIVVVEVAQEAILPVLDYQ
jgi:hypothetical protein